MGRFASWRKNGQPMKSIEEKTTTHNQPGLDAQSIHAAIEELRTPLTVIRGHGQLIRRRLRQRPVRDRADLLASLAAIEAAALALEARLRALTDQANGL